MHMYIHTSSLTRPARWNREDLINWKMSATASVLTLSSTEYMHMNAPVLPIPSLQRDEKAFIAEVFDVQQVLYTVCTNTKLNILWPVMTITQVFKFKIHC